MSQNIGTAYIQVAVSGEGVQRQIEDQIGEGASRGGKGFMAGVGKWSKRAGALGATIAAGFAIKGGMARLMAIDDAEGKLRGLGFTASDISTVMDNALSAVRGTAFGLGDAATAAASATAAGIKQGAELENYLRLIGDAATIGGTSFTEMGSIINKVTAQGKAGMENLNQLTERGIPILQWLADEYGVTGAELSKMVSRGEVDAATFRKVIEDNIGGAALESGKTFRGALANLGAALGRIGANLIGPVFAKLTPLMGTLTTNLGSIEAAAKPMGAALGRAFSVAVSAVSALARVIGPLVRWLAANKEVVLALAAGYATYRAALVVANAVSWAQYLWASKDVIIKASQIALTNALAIAQKGLNTALRANPIGLVITALTLAAAAVIYLWKNSETFRTVVLKVWAAVKTSIAAVGNWIASWLPGVWNKIKAATTVVFKAISTYIRIQVKVWSTVLRGIWSAISAVIGFFGRLHSGVVSAVARVIGVVRDLPAKIRGFFSGAASWLRSVGEDIMRGLVAGIERGFAWVRSKLSGVGRMIPGWLKGVLGIASPSKVMAKEVGQWIPAGVAEGIDGNSAVVQRALTGLVGDLSAPSLGINAGPFAGTAAAPSAAGFTRADLDYLADRIAAASRNISVRTVDHREYVNEGQTRFPSPVAGVRP